MNPLSPASRVALIWVALSGSIGLAACTSLKPGNVLPPDAGRTPRLVTTDCAHAEPPGPPPPNSTADPERDYVFAAHIYDLGDTPDTNGGSRFPLFGYDVDHTCTGQGQGQSCKLPEWQTTPVLDGPDGRDNSSNDVYAYATMFTKTVTVSDLDAGPANMEGFAFDSNVDAASGRTTVIFLLRGYNGENNDDQVEVSIVSGTLWMSQISGPKPLWEGTDRWHPTSAWLNEKDGMPSNDVPRFSDPHAYVRDNALVAHLNTLLVGFAYVPAGLWRKALVTGRLSHPVGAAGDASLELHDVTLTGRWPIDVLLNYLARTQDQKSGEIRCQVKPVYDASKAIFCQHVDLSALRDDGSAVCDAVSVVYHIDTVPAELDDPIKVEPYVWQDCQVTDCAGMPLRPPP